MRAFQTYHEYEVLLAREALLPRLGRWGISLDKKRVLDVGCGEGGILVGLASHFRFSGLGIDRDSEMVCRCPPAEGIRFEAADFFSFAFQEQFDFILLRDVLEHCGDAAAMIERAATLLNGKGHVYVTYCPYASPFGGHQHNGTGCFSYVPYLQFLPESLFLRIVRPKGNLYKGASGLEEDLRTIRRTRLSTAIVHAACDWNGLRLRDRQVFIVRPDYRLKFGLPTLAWPRFLPMASILDPFCTGVELLLQKE